MTTSADKIEFQSFKETEKKLTTVRKEYAIDQLVTFPLSTQSYKIGPLKSERFTLQKKSFLKDLLRHDKDENKKGKV